MKSTALRVVYVVPVVVGVFFAAVSGVLYIENKVLVSLLNHVVEKNRSNEEYYKQLEKDKKEK